MITKLQAARLASRSGITSVIAEGSEPKVLLRILEGEPLGTRIEAATNGLESRKRWLVMEKPHGTIQVDAGAARKLQTGGASLLPVGVMAVSGLFERSASVMVIGPDNKEIAQGLSSYSSKAIQQLCGVHSNRISEILGYSYGDAIIHRNNMVLLA
jgi:glutamate 5-kinase